MLPLLIAMAPQNRIALACLVGFGLLCALAGLFLMHRVPSQRQVLEKWASENGFELKESRRRIWLCGPFTFHRTTTQGIFRITARDAAGHHRKGFARVGGFTGLGDYVKVAWDREPESDVGVGNVGDML